MPSDKHMEAARAILDDININDMSAAPAIATALANAEREGMKRAAEIARDVTQWIEHDGDFEAHKVAAAILSEAGEQPT